ncbi:hypothetical protein DFH07DRAFT_975294 [Mycena maculata]|uniref:NAD(P)-binding protein n=1 Tax=Mycena maculata TaxID=230809 RepID=A0AAD7KGC1_9AGAR|nr:hypothetical protein DFH07DRAFT_975294 [Mycena maculata]
MSAKPVVRITGCSTGFGREFALAALSAGLRVIATARRPETLASLEEVVAKVLKLDVTSHTEEFKRANRRSHQQCLQGGAVEENSPEDLAQFNTTGSQGATLCIAGAGIYCASKAALDAISDTWARDLAPFNIRCISIQPGAFRTAVAQSSNLKIAVAKIDGYQGAHDWVDSFRREGGKERGHTKIAAAKMIELIFGDPIEHPRCVSQSGKMPTRGRCLRI